jgi:hypothetical protein
VVFIQPVAQIRRQQQRLLSVTAEEVLSHGSASRRRRTETPAFARHPRVNAALLAGRPDVLAQDEERESSPAASRRFLSHEAVAEIPPEGVAAASGRFQWRQGRFRPPIYAVAAAWLWLWSFTRLWVAVIRRHCVRAADLPRR